MLKICRVCDVSQKDFKEGKGLLKVQGLKFDIDYNINNSNEVIINNEKMENARIVKLASKPVIIDIDELTNITKQTRKDLKNGIIENANANYNSLPCIVTYNKNDKEFYIILDLELLLYI